MDTLHLKEQHHLQAEQKGGDVGPELRTQFGLEVGYSFQGVGMRGITSEESQWREEGRGQSRTEPEEEWERGSS